MCLKVVEVVTELAIAYNKPANSCLSCCTYAIGSKLNDICLISKVTVLELTTTKVQWLPMQPPSQQFETQVGEKQN